VLVAELRLYAREALADKTLLALETPGVCATLLPVAAGETHLTGNVMPGRRPARRATAALRAGSDQLPAAHLKALSVGRAAEGVRFRYTNPGPDWLKKTYDVMTTLERQATPLGRRLRRASIVLVH